MGKTLHLHHQPAITETGHALLLLLSSCFFTNDIQDKMNLSVALPPLLSQVESWPLRRQPAEQLRDGDATAARGASAVEQHRQLGQLQPARPAARHHQGQQLQRHLALPRPGGQHSKQQEHQQALQNRQERRAGRESCNSNSVD